MYLLLINDTFQPQFVRLNTEQGKDETHTHGLLVVNHGPKGTVFEISTIDSMANQFLRYV